MTSNESIPLGKYLFSRIRQLGITKIFGCPGDYNMPLLDHIYTVDGLDWIGNCNELNAAYAADGYARVRGLPGVLVTTFGVGELSAINGISGAFSEHVPVLHIVGTPVRPEMENSLWMHHTIPAGSNDEAPDHYIYERMSEPVRCASAHLDNVNTAADEIDRVIFTSWRKSLPAYIFVPLDMTMASVPVSRLETPLQLVIKNSDSKLDEELADKILDAIYSAKKPAILADILARRHRSRELVMSLVDKTRIPSFATDMAKGFVDEDHPAFVGQYNGRLSRPGVAEAMEESDLVINIGPLLTDSNTGGFTRNISEENTIMFHPWYVNIQGKKYENLHFLPVLEHIVKKIDASKLACTRWADSIKVGNAPPAVSSESDITTSDFYTNTVTKFLKPNDIVLAESGTAQYGINDTVFPTNVNFTTQLYYSSIGFTLPAALGACAAVREMEEQNIGPKMRVVLFEGDGSSMMTIQELSTIVRYKFNPVIFLINNSGYTIERALHGPHALYNDIAPNWKYTELFRIFGGSEDSYITSKASSKKELAGILNSEEFEAQENKARFIEIVMGKYDIPWRLREQAEQMNKHVQKWTTEYYAKKGEKPRPLMLHG
ncbi:thiamine diphosphate-binding protein [Dipodascopsis uninucleata]